MTTTQTYDADAIAQACLAEQLEYLVDMDTPDIADAAAERGVAVPADEDDEEQWDRIASALGVLADRVRAHLGIEQEGKS